MFIYQKTKSPQSTATATKENGQDEKPLLQPASQPIKKDQPGDTSPMESHPSASAVQTAPVQPLGNSQILPNAENFWQLLHSTGELHDPSQGFALF